MDHKEGESRQGQSQKRKSYLEGVSGVYIRGRLWVQNMVE